MAWRGEVEDGTGYGSGDGGGDGDASDWADTDWSAA